METVQLYSQRKAIRCELVGDRGVGKTCLLISYTTHAFLAKDTNIPTCSTCYSTQLAVDERPVRLAIFDMERPWRGDARFKPQPYFTDSDVLLVCFSLACPQSFENIKLKWWPELRAAYPAAPAVLVGTKLDLREDPDTVRCLRERQLAPVSYQQGESMAREVGATSYLECSAMSQKGLRAMLEAAALAVLHPSRPPPPPCPSPCPDVEDGLYETIEEVKQDTTA